MTKKRGAPSSLGDSRQNEKQSVRKKTVYVITRERSCQASLNLQVESP